MSKMLGAKTFGRHPSTHAQNISEWWESASGQSSERPLIVGHKWKLPEIPRALVPYRLLLGYQRWWRLLSGLMWLSVHIDQAHLVTQYCKGWAAVVDPGSKYGCTSRCAVQEFDAMDAMPWMSWMSWWPQSFASPLTSIPNSLTPIRPVSL